MVKYWFENNREASFKMLADILEEKMSMTLSYTPKSFFTSPRIHMESDLIEAFLEHWQLKEPLPDSGALARVLSVEVTHQDLENNKTQVMNIIKEWINLSCKNKQPATCTFLMLCMKNAIKMQRGQGDTTVAPPSGKYNYYNAIKKAN